jgi:glyoxylase-like metal-dependent hydrolase (beta-lactamase superfamily II)
MTSGLPDVSRTIADRELIQWAASEWTALETNGHAEGHLCLHAERTRVLISGDQVLPTISSNIGFTWRSRDPNPLGSFLASLERLHALPAETLVLPSHGVPFRGLHARVEDLRSHHNEQLEALVQACNEPKTAFDVLPVMFRRPLQGMHFFLAMAEALAHLEYLAAEARVQREIDRDGVHRYVVR